MSTKYTNNFVEQKSQNVDSVVVMECDIMELLGIQEALLKTGIEIDIFDIRVIQFGGYHGSTWKNDFGKGVCEEFNNWKQMNQNVIILKKKVLNTKIRNHQGSEFINMQITALFCPFKKLRFVSNKVLEGRVPPPVPDKL